MGYIGRNEESEEDTVDVDDVLGIGKSSYR